MNDLITLLDRAKSGKITDAELRSVAEQLSHKPGSSEYTLLHILGRGYGKMYRSVVEPYLKNDDAMLARLSLQILCSYWGDTEKYLAELKAFLAGSPTDPENYVRLTAVSVSGEYLRNNRNLELLALLYGIFCNKNEPRLLREASYVALARAVGKKWNEVPSASHYFDLDSKVDTGVIRQVEGLLRLTDSSKKK